MVRHSFTWKSKEKGLRHGGVKRRRGPSSGVRLHGNMMEMVSEKKKVLKEGWCLVGYSFTWEYKRKSFRKSGQKKKGGKVLGGEIMYTQKGERKQFYRK